MAVSTLFSYARRGSGNHHEQKRIMEKHGKSIHGKSMEIRMENPWKHHGKSMDKSMGNPCKIKTKKHEMFPWYSLVDQKMTIWGGCPGSRFFWGGSFFGKLIGFIAPEMVPWLSKKPKDQPGGPRTNLEAFGDEVSFQYFPKT